MRVATGAQAWPKARGLLLSQEHHLKAWLRPRGKVLPRPHFRPGAPGTRPSHGAGHTGKPTLTEAAGGQQPGSSSGGPWSQRVRPRCGVAQPGLLSARGLVRSLWTSANCACAFQATAPHRSQLPQWRPAASNTPLLGDSGQATEAPARLGWGLQFPQNPPSGCLSITHGLDSPEDQARWPPHGWASSE